MISDKNAMCKRIAEGNDIQKEKKKVIDLAIGYGFTDEEIRALQDESLSVEQMEQGLYGFLYGLNKYDVQMYLRSEIDVSVMEQMRYIMIKPEERKLIPIIKNKFFDVEQLLELRGACHLPKWNLELLADPNFTKEQMNILKSGFEQHTKYMHLICKPQLSVNQMRYLCKLSKLHMSYNKMKQLAYPDVSEEFLYNIIKRVKGLQKCHKKDQCAYAR